MRVFACDDATEWLEDDVFNGEVVSLAVHEDVVRFREFFIVLVGDDDHESVLVFFDFTGKFEGDRLLVFGVFARVKERKDFFDVFFATEDDCADFDVF